MYRLHNVSNWFIIYCIKYIWICEHVHQVERIKCSNKIFYFTTNNCFHTSTFLLPSSSGTVSSAGIVYGWVARWRGEQIRQTDITGPSCIKPCNFTRNYAVYWSQLTTNSQRSLRPVSSEKIFAFAQLNRHSIDVVRSLWGIPVFVLCLNNLCSF